MNFPSFSYSDKWYAVAMLIGAVVPFMTEDDKRVAKEQAAFNIAMNGAVWAAHTALGIKWFTGPSNQVMLPLTIGGIGASIWLAEAKKNAPQLAPKGVW